MILNNNFSNKKININNIKITNFSKKNKNYNDIINNKKNKLIFNLSNDNIFNKNIYNKNRNKSNDNKNDKLNKTFNIEINDDEKEKVFNNFDIFKRLENTLIINSEKFNNNNNNNNNENNNNNIKIKLKYEDFLPNFNDLYSNDRFSFKK